MRASSIPVQNLYYLYCPSPTDHLSFVLDNRYDHLILGTSYKVHSRSLPLLTLCDSQGLKNEYFVLMFPQSKVRLRAAFAILAMFY